MRCLVFGLAVLTTLASAEAQQGGNPAAAAPAAEMSLAVPAPPPAPADPLDAAVLARVEAIRARAAGTTDLAWAERLAAFYAERLGRPVWIEGDGLSPRALATIAEIGRAGDWGLDAKAFSIPRPADADAGASPVQRAGAEIKLTLAILKYIEHARGGRLDPSTLSRWLDQSPKPVDPQATLTAAASAADPADFLRKLHPRHAQFEALRQAYLKLRPAPRAEPETRPVRVPDGPRIKPGDRHPDIALIRQRLSVPAGAAGDGDLYDDKLETAVRAHLKSGGFKVVSVVTREVRAALNQPARAALAGPADLRKVLVNMERWRWLPDDLGALHVWNNLPEFETRLVKGGTTMHQERIIIGKPETQTPVFSDRIRFVVFQPEWGVPSSIKVKSLLPSLQDGDYDVLERRNMRISVNGRTVDPGKYDWDRTDIRRVPIVQDAGPENPLGQMKFMFPNRHDVYMHDTPAKGLFNAAVRTFSHGCIRVRNPRRLAEIILAETSGRTAAEAAETVAAGTGTGAKPGNRVDLARAVPVHNTYFTLVADTAGGLRSLPDIYGHDRRIAAVLLDGRPASVIREQDPALKQQREIEEIVSASNTVKPKKSEVRIAARKSMASPSFLGALFGN